MSLIDTSFVQVVAEGLGIKADEDTAKTLAPDVEYRLREIVQEATKFARHAKRTYITPEDVNNAFKLRNVEPIYGLSSSSDPSRFSRAAGHFDVLYAEDPTIPLSTILNTPLPSVPWEAGLTVHWLAVNGKQPHIPENAPLLPLTHREKRQRTESGRHPHPALLPPPPQQQLPSLLPTAAASAAAGGNGVFPAAAAAAVGAQPPSQSISAIITSQEEGGGGGGGDGGALLRAPLKHIVSKELHLYYSKVVAALEHSSPPPAPPSKELLAALSSLRSDAGLQPLAPYLSHFVVNGVAKNISSTPRLGIFLRAAICIGSNSSLDVGPYLHELLPAVLTCLLAEKIGLSGNLPMKMKMNGEDGEEEEEGEKEKQKQQLLLLQGLDGDGMHWGVREEAARATAALCNCYPDAAPRVQRQLVSALTDANCSLATRYGAVVGLEAQGPRAVRALLLPNLIPAVAMLTKDLTGINGVEKFAAAVKVRGALLTAAGYCVYLSGVCDRWGASSSLSGGGGRRNIATGGGGKEQKDQRKGRKQQQPRLAVLTPAQAHAASLKLKSTAATVAGGGKKSGGGGGGGKKGGKKSGTTKSTLSSSPALSLSEVFDRNIGEEHEVEEEEEGSAEAAAAVQASLRKLPRNIFRPANGLANDRNASASADMDVRFMDMDSISLPTTNYLAEAWKEDFSVDEMHRGLAELFGCDVEPYLSR